MMLPIFMSAPVRERSSLFSLQT